MPPKAGIHKPLFLSAIVLLAAIPLGIWSNLFDPTLLLPFMDKWPATWAGVLAGILCAALVLIPLTWILTNSVLDLFSFFFAQNALLIFGYFFLGITAFRLTATSEILEAGSLVILINAIGFAALFATLGITYFIETIRHVRIAPLRTTPESYDLRVIWLLRGVGVLIAVFLALPMVRTGVIPMLAPDAAAARAANAESDIQRALYNMGAAIMPFIVGGLLIFCLRRPLRGFGLDCFILLLNIFVQILSGNRFPLAVAAFVSLTLLSMEKRFSRFFLIMALGSCMFFFTAISGLTGLLRVEREKLQQGSIVTRSLYAAFVGDNLIDVRDAAWVFSQWDFEPLMGRTYLGGLVSMMPSGLFPQKKEWHLGLTGVRIVGWDPDNHFGLRVTFFGEAFLNFGLAGILILGCIFGIFSGVLLRVLHLTSRKRPPCLHFNLKLVLLMQMCMPLTNTSDAFTFWTMGGFLIIQWLTIDLPFIFGFQHTESFAHAKSRA